MIPFDKNAGYEVFNAMGDKMRTLAFLVGAVVAGSTLPDIDHLFPPYQRTFGHIAAVPVAILSCLALSSVCRYAWAWVLTARRWETRWRLSAYSKGPLIRDGD